MFRFGRTPSRTSAYQGRPSKAIIFALQRERDALQDVLIRLKNSSEEERGIALENLRVSDGTVQLPSPVSTADSSVDPLAPGLDHRRDSSGSHLEHETSPSSWLPQNDLSMTALTESNEHDTVSGVQNVPSDDPIHVAINTPFEPVPDNLGFQLTANAALQLQKEHGLRRLAYIRGVPADLAMHLLDLHWGRQHHTFHLTYRPLFMRELLEGGSYCTDFLFNAVLASSSKFSERAEVNNDKRFFVRCDELLAQQSLLTYSSIPTIIGLLLLGATFNARGSSSKGWLYTGYALRMVYDLGLHLDVKTVDAQNAESVEIRRRVFWGAFCTDKLQCLYHGRSAYIELRDTNVSRNFMDTIEELELWMPYIDPQSPDNGPAATQRTPTPIYSISTFQNLCTLCMIMTRVINHFYIVGATKENTPAELDSIDRTLSTWYRNLPQHLVFEPSSNPNIQLQNVPSPNVIILLTTYNALIILLHRPFISNSDLKSTSIPTTSWRKCTAAARNITNLVLAYQSAYPLRRSSYLLSYAVYVACTIHVRNLATKENNSSSEGDKYTSPLLTCLRFLDVLSLPNGGVCDLANIIRRLMVDNGVPNVESKMPRLLELAEG